jgi:hypothetical protein
MKVPKYFRLNEDQLNKLEKITIELFNISYKNRTKTIESIVNEEFNELSLDLE